MTSLRKLRTRPLGGASRNISVVGTHPSSSRLRASSQSINRACMEDGPPATCPYSALFACLLHFFFPKKFVLVGYMAQGCTKYAVTKAPANTSE